MPSEDELEHLRALVGPSEVSYRQLADDLAAASVLAKQAVLDAGRLRGEMQEMSVQLARARQDQDTMQRRRELGPGAYLADLTSEYWSDAVRPALGRTKRRLLARRHG